MIAVSAVEFDPEDFVIVQLVVLLPFACRIVASEKETIVRYTSNWAKIKSGFGAVIEYDLNSGPHIPFHH